MFKTVAVCRLNQEFCRKSAQLRRRHCI